MREGDGSIFGNGDKATHDEECAYCNKVLVGKDHQPCTFDKVGGKVVDNIDPYNQNSGKPTGQVFLVCSKCNQSKQEFETCLHEGTRAFRDNGDGNHTEYCTRCGLDLFPEAHEMVDEAVKTPVANGSGQTAVAYQGTYAHKCSKCSYRELKQCPHEATHVVRIGGGDYEQHDLYCDKCKAFVERVKCSNFTRTCMNSSTHSKTCAECGSVHGYFGHDWQRKITKVDAIPRACKTSAWLNPNKLFFTYYDYRIHYTENCKQCKATRVGAYLYKTNDINGSFNYKKAFQALVNMSSEDLKNVHSIWEGGGSYLLPVGNALAEPLMSTLQPVTALVGWDSVEYASLDFAQLVGWEGSTESPGDGYKVYTADGKLVESAKVPGDVPNPAWSVEGGSGAQTQGLQAQGVLPRPVDSADKVPAIKSVKAGALTLGAGDYTVGYTDASGKAVIQIKGAGAYRVVVTGKGNFTGTVSAPFTVINPKTTPVPDPVVNPSEATGGAEQPVIVLKGTKIKKLTAKKKGFVVKWKAQKAQATGYQIRCATNAKFKKAKTVTVKKSTKTSAKVTKLKAKKKYFVQIRTYKTVGDTTCFSAWSKAKTVVTKK